ncbi:MAG: hypothetical protein AB7T06_26460 [Kofleriaceae bacterium]
MLSAIALGAAQGARHSLEPDHLAAVSVLIKESRSAQRSAFLGAVWGLGHTLSLVAMSVALVAVGNALPDAADRAFTFLVAGVLIFLGARSIRSHHRPETMRAARTSWQALGIGAVHGLAGTSALTAAVFAALPTSQERLVYISLFGVGSIAGMAAVSGFAGLWLGRIVRPWLLRTLGVTIGVISIAIGIHTALTAAGAV